MTFLCSIFKVAPTRQDHKALALQEAQFPLCARCTGELAGILLAAFTWWAAHPGAVWAALLMVPLVADGVIQLCTAYESRNRRRLWTGILFGYALTDLFLLSTQWALQWGYSVGLEMRGL